MSDITTEFVEVTITVPMSRKVCIEMPKEYTQEELKEKAKNEIPTPDKIMFMMRELLRTRFGISISDADDWEVDEVNISI